MPNQPVAISSYQHKYIDMEVNLVTSFILPLSKPGVIEVSQPV